MKTKAVFIMKRKNGPVFFSGIFDAANIQLPHVENTVFTIRAQPPGSQKHVS